jgi:hypothetical protein
VARRAASRRRARKAIPLVTLSEGGVVRRSQRWLPGWSSGALGAVDHSETCKRCGPPPSLRSAAAVLAAARVTGARPDAATPGGRSAERLAERGARGEPPGEESAASASPRGGLGSPRGLTARWRHGIESDLGPTAARSEVRQRLWGSRDTVLLQSRSPRRVHQPIESGGGLWVVRTGNRRSAPRSSTGR